MTVSINAMLLERLRAESPLIQCITNNVVTNFTANACLSIGAAPAMIDIIGEAGLFARVAGGVLINLGTPHPEQRAAALEAADGAVEVGTPWVLDPVGVGPLPVRSELADRLLQRGPYAVRGNASEILALAGAGAGGRGVESTDSIDEAAGIFIKLARRCGSVVAVSGPEDFITDGQRVLRVANGDELLTKVTGGGCALGALVAAFAAVRGEVSAVEAVAAAHCVYGIAAEQAAELADGPGTFAFRLIDALHRVSPGDVDQRERVRFVEVPAAL